MIFSINVYAFEIDSSICFINSTKGDNEIILCKIISYLDFDSFKSVCPKRMQVEVIEILKGKDSSRFITIEGENDLNSNHLECLIFYNIGSLYILGLENHKLSALGRHSLNYSNDIVNGIISKEPTKEFLKSQLKVYEKIQKERLSKKTTLNKINTLNNEFFSLWETQNQKMNYHEFKKQLEL